MALVLYHNPRCSKSREALRLLTMRGHEPRILLYLDTPPSTAALKQLLKKLGLTPRELMRISEPVYQSLGLENPVLSDAALIKAMSENPVLIERPIVISGPRAVIGRQPERVLEIL